MILEVHIHCSPEDVWFDVVHIFRGDREKFEQLSEEKGKESNDRGELKSFKSLKWSERHT